jgi:hypothetical protein
MSETGKAKNGQQIGQEAVDNFDSWVEAMTDEDWPAIVHGGQIRRTEIMKHAKCGRPALTQNKPLAKKIRNLEDKLREKGLLPPLSSRGECKSELDNTKPFDQNLTKRVRQSEHLSHLEAENQRLKAQNNWLKQELSRYEEISDTLYELGTLIR